METFWKKVRRGAPMECWPWTAGTTSEGYGHHKIRGRWWRAHRLAYFLLRKELPPLLRHSCNNPRCCNPEHLVPGTAAENAADMVRAGRQRTGLKPWRLTIDDARAIRRLHGLLTHDELAALFNKTRSGIRKIVRGDSLPG